MHNLFEHHTGWTDEPCYYVVAFKGNRRACSLVPMPRGAKPRTFCRERNAGPSAKAGTRSVKYHYRVAQHYNGHDRSILGRSSP